MSVPHEIRDRRGGMTLNSVTKVCTGEIWTLLNILSVTSQGTIILTICKTVYSLLSVAQSCLVRSIFFYKNYTLEK